MNELKKFLLEESAYYDAPMTDLKLIGFANQLANVPLHLLKAAAIKFRDEPGRTRMPMPADYKSALNPKADPRTEAVESASRVHAAVARFGWTGGADARPWIGELGWLAVERFGGWQRVCELLGTRELPLTTFQAQVRDLCEAQLRRGTSAPPALQQTEQQPAGLASAAETLKAITRGLNPGTNEE